MTARADLFGSPFVAWEGSKARRIALSRLRQSGHHVTTWRGRSRLVAFYTDPGCTRGAIIHRLASGRVSVQRIGALKPREVAFLHSLASEVG